MNWENLLNKNEGLTVSEEVKTLLKDKIILITGAAGSIGSEISKILAQQCNSNLILLDRAESDLFDLEQELRLLNFKNYKLIVGDICDKESMQKLFSKNAPNIVYHAAAYKHVPLMEDHPFAAVKVNVLGTKIIADLSKKFGVNRFVLVSTDKAVNPTSVMGASKRVAELYVSSLNSSLRKEFKIVRFGNVPNSNGSVIPLFNKQLQNGGPITITDKEASRYFIAMSSACQVMLEAIVCEDGDLLIGHMGVAVNIHELALKLIQVAELKFPEAIEIEYVGLRPGEKLHEELTYREEIMIAESRSKIKKYNVSAKKGQKKLIEDLCLLNAGTPDIEFVMKLKEIVPEFISNNAKYGILDA